MSLMIYQKKITNFVFKNGNNMFFICVITELIFQKFLTLQFQNSNE